MMNETTDDWNRPSEGKPRSRYTLEELLAEAMDAGLYPVSEEQREWVDAPPAGRELL